MSTKSGWRKSPAAGILQRLSHDIVLESRAQRFGALDLQRRSELA